MLGSSSREGQKQRKKSKYQVKYRKQKDRQGDNHGMSCLTKKLMFSWKKLKKGSGGAVSEGLEPGCRLRSDVERRGNRVSKNKPPAPESTDEKEMEVGKRK